MRLKSKARKGKTLVESGDGRRRRWERATERARCATMCELWMPIFVRMRWQAGLQRNKSADLLTWGKRFLPEHFRVAPSAMQRWIATELDGLEAGDGAKLNVVGPRGGAKSTLVTLAYVLRAAVEGHERYIWIVSDTRGQACAHLVNLRSELTDNRRLRAVYPAAVERGRVWRESALALGNGVSIEAYGTGQQLRGRRHRASRPTLIVCDDLQNDAHAESALRRERTRRWFHGTLMKAGTRRTNVIHLGTALHREALAMELQATPGWKSRRFQAVMQWPTDMALWEDWTALYSDVERQESKAVARAFFEEHRAAMEAGAEVLWPAEEDLYQLMCMRAESGRTAFEREKQSSPINPELCEWPESYFDDTIWFEDWPRELTMRTVALDPSKGKDDRRGDYSAYVMLGVDRGGMLYLEADLARRPTPQMVSDGVEICRRFRPAAFGVEANQFQELLGESFEAEFRQQGLVISPWTLDNRVNKRVRIRRLGPYLAQRRLRFKSDSASTRLLVEQLKDFPVGDHDDGPDAAEMAIRLAAELMQADVAADDLGDRLPLDGE